MPRQNGEMESPSDTLVDTYLRALRTSDVQLAVSLFTADGIVDSPLYGELPAREFYPALFADTAESVLTLRKTLLSEDQTTIAFWFDFGWVLAGGAPAPFTVVDVAELQQGLISRLHIVYDTHPIRDAWARQHGSSTTPTSKES
jgi:hypothetical protein